VGKHPSQPLPYHFLATAPFSRIVLDGLWFRLRQATRQFWRPLHSENDPGFSVREQRTLSLGYRHCLNPYALGFEGRGNSRTDARRAKN
jgi:hypothetical protein